MKDVTINETTTRNLLNPQRQKFEEAKELIELHKMDGASNLQAKIRARKDLGYTAAQMNHVMAFEAREESLINEAQISDFHATVREMSKHWG